MNSNITLTQKQLSEFLLNVALVRPVFIWGAPGIGKSSLVENFALELGLTCVSLLGSHALFAHRRSERTSANWKFAHQKI